MPIDYAAEKAASEARRKARLAEADAAYTEWYQDVEGRLREFDVLIPKQMARKITTKPRCWCEKATFAIGLCRQHYFEWWHATKRNRVKRNHAALCHPDRPHHGRGLCEKCYDAEPDVRLAARSAVAAHRSRTRLTSAPRSTGRRLRKAWRCPHTDRRHYARGLCKNCWVTAQRHRSGRAKPRVQYKQGVPLKCGHPYDPKTRPCDGWCRKCYDKRRWLAGETKQGVGTHYVHPEGAPLLCEHSDRPHWAKGCCRPCYRKGVWREPTFMRKIQEAIVARRAA